MQYLVNYFQLLVILLFSFLNNIYRDFIMYLIIFNCFALFIWNHIFIFNESKSVISFSLLFVYLDGSTQFFMRILKIEKNSLHCQNYVLVVHKVLC